MQQSLNYRKHHLANQSQQRKILKETSSQRFVPFQDRLKKMKASPLRSDKIQIFQINLGYLCNQVCKHCHVDAGPDRKEMMTFQTIELLLDILQKKHLPALQSLDITGGAPEMHPNFHYLVQQARAMEIPEIIVRSNLTIIVSHPKYNDLPKFFRDHQVRVISSLPFYNAERTDRQRGDNVFQKSVDALQMLNAQGYGKANTGLILDLVYNPNGAFLSANQRQLEREYKHELKENFGIEFNQLFTITNTPISRFLEFLLETGNYSEYMEKLVSSFNPATLSSLMCKNTISVDYQGYLYDCDFNQMLGMPVDSSCTHVKDFQQNQLEQRNIQTGQHCYACTAGAGSSCQGSIA